MVIALLKYEDLSVEKGQNFEEEDCVGRVVNIHERHQCDHLIYIDKNPERLKTGLSKE